MTSDRGEALLEELDRLIAEYVAATAPRAGGARRVNLSEPVFDEREAQAALRTILSNWISQGPKVREFEAAFARYVGVGHGIAVNSGSSANLLALAAALEAGDLLKGDEVIVPATTFATVASPVLQLGCVPVYVDVDARTYNLDPDGVAVAIGPRTRWVMVVHTVGSPADMDRIMDVSARHGLEVIEDSCEAHGAAIRGRRVGSFGRITTSSFFVAHNMTTGEGGMILTSDDRYAALCRSLREFGRIDQSGVSEERFYSDDVLAEYDRRYVFERLGFNVRMTDVTASFGIEQLKKLEVMNERRIANAAFLSAALARFEAFLQLPVVADGHRHTYYTYPITVRPERGVRRADLVRFLEGRGIETRPIFAGCLPDQPAFRRAPHRVVGDLGNARRIRDHAFFIGVHPGLGTDDLEHIVGAFEAFFAERGLD